MGVYVYAVFRHNMSKKEILDLPAKMDAWGDIKAFVERSKNYLDLEPYARDRPLRKSEWDAAISEDLLERIWVYRENRGKNCMPIYIGINDLHTFFGTMTICRHTVMICQDPHGKYSNLQDPETARYIFELNRRIVKRFAETELFYCIDSAFRQSEIYYEARWGKSLDALTKFADDNYGPVLKDLNLGIRKGFFLDDSRQEIGTLEPWTWPEFEEAVS